MSGIRWDVVRMGYRCCWIREVQLGPSKERLPIRLVQSKFRASFLFQLSRFRCTAPNPNQTTRTPHPRGMLVRKQRVRHREFCICSIGFSGGGRRRTGRQGHLLHLVAKVTDESKREGGKGWVRNLCLSFEDPLRSPQETEEGLRRGER